MAIFAIKDLMHTVVSLTFHFHLVDTTIANNSCVALPLPKA